MHVSLSFSFSNFRTYRLLLLISWFSCCFSLDEDDFLLCKQCGHEIVSPVSLRNIKTPKSLRQRNETICGKKGVLIQYFENPQNQAFEVITAVDADIAETTEPSADHTWFPGYEWSIAVCPKCGQHLGWKFTAGKAAASSKKTSFVGLVLDNLLSNDYVDSLIITPKFRVA